MEGFMAEVTMQKVAPQYIQNLFGCEPKVDEGRRGTTYSAGEVFDVKVDNYGGCHINILQPGNIPEGMQSAATTFVETVHKNGLHDSVWFNFPNGASYRSIGNTVPESYIATGENNGTIQDLQNGGG